VSTDTVPEVVPAEAAVPAPKPIDAVDALDPVCGMRVVIAGARHTAEHEGRTYYFCCGGCRERFLATPERYLQKQVIA
jgi:Cu+-exporting ATPase